jgi:6,7-dimethyl-8-ribityllumazine synthase
MSGTAMIAGEESARGLRVAVVATRYNEPILERLRAGALEALQAHGARDEDIDVVLVPGAFELPLAVRAVAAVGRHDAIVESARRASRA